MALPDQTVIPGLVGMHEHLFYPSGGGVPLYIEHGMSFPRLYLASGVTTARTAGTLEPYTDLNLKKMIDQSRMPGPKMLITVGYLEGHGSFAPQMAELDTPDDARRFVESGRGWGRTLSKPICISHAASWKPRLALLTHAG